MSKITFIGAGNMARSLIGGLVKEPGRGASAEKVCATDPDAEQRAGLEKAFGIQTEADNSAAVSDADTVILAVKPHIVKTVCEEIGTALKEDALIVSIAAGVRGSDITNWLDTGGMGKRAVVRCMPNTPALLGAGISGLFANQHCSADHRKAAESILGAAGSCVWVEQENDLDTVTAVSGSGPAYFFHMIECMTQAGSDMGLPADTAENLAIETAYGAALMARQRTVSPSVLRENVTSKNGTTAAALASFGKNNFPDVINAGMRAARDRAEELADEMSGS